MSKISEYKKKTRGIDKVHVEKAKGGYITSTHQKHEAGEYKEPSTQVHKNLKSVHDHMKDCFEPEGNDTGVAEKE